MFDAIALHAGCEFPGYVGGVPAVPFITVAFTQSSIGIVLVASTLRTGWH